MTMTRNPLADYSNVQLRRIYIRLYSRLPDGGCYGWDMPTMRICYPAILRSMKQVFTEVRRRGLDW